VPKASVDEDSEAAAGKDDVGSHPPPIGLETIVLAEAGAGSMKSGTKAKLRAGVRLSIGKH
jgi:hypothetical protein